MLAGGVEAARAAPSASPVNPGKPENADQCVGPKPDRRTPPRDPGFWPLGLCSKGRAALVECDADELDRVSVVGAAACTLGLAECSPGLLHPGCPPDRPSLWAPDHLAKSEEPDGGPPGDQLH